MGGPCELRIYAENFAIASRAADAACAEIRRLENKYSRYRNDSITTAINASAGNQNGISVDDETAGLLDYAATVYQHSSGLFDITSGILRQVWDFQSGRLPAQQDVEALLPKIGWYRVRWEKPRICLPLVGMQLDFGGYVKEYAADSAAKLLREEGIENGIVDLGGDLAVVGPRPGGRHWAVGIRNPRAPATALLHTGLIQGGLASSGDYERFMLINGKRYSHILNPMTGWPVETLSGVSVIAEQCLVAGTATTVAMLKGEKDGLQWLEELGLPYFAIDRQNRVSGTMQALPNET